MKLRVLSLGIIGATTLLLTGCGPPQVEKSDKAGANEVGIVYTLEGDVMSNQAQLDPRQLDPEMVQGRLVIHPQRKRKTGFWWQWWRYDWLPTQKMVKISLLPVSRKWTPDSTTGTSNKDDTIRVESSNSIGVRLGVTIQTGIADTTKYAYHFADKPLSEVTDQIIWGRAQRTASDYFGSIHIDELRGELGNGREVVKTDLDKFCDTYGIEVVTFGWFGGIAYDPARPMNDQERANPELLAELDIQANLNRVFKAENDILVAEEEQVKRVRELNIGLDRARAERRQALLVWAQRDGALTRVKLDLLERANAANAAFLTRWDGKTSDIVPVGSGPLWFLEDSPVNAYITRLEQLASVDNPALDALAAEEARIAAEEAANTQRELEERRLRDTGDLQGTEVLPSGN